MRDESITEINSKKARGISNRLDFRAKNSFALRDIQLQNRAVTRSLLAIPASGKRGREQVVRRRCHLVTEPLQQRCKES